ncbi:prion-inhibition and propagation-domain-containing protein [Hypoxylon trugodes]|uniref:prion-inhibition and propagation-domain-containing protein n=1 Tax=Hypoxylon trugodes TaxID=326681 RepID=UPI00219F8741|nr:prion-inhibition and propagation-domain-containing protein [Hypoxylon trugodes]KAI1388289.1 prion-inhibition and propagation-domain-containing protein [Hypoxylon trugodes]
MAEAFGIVSGAVGIAGIFSTCVECFDYIQIGRRFGKDFQTELLTLSLLKLRLSRWGEAVHINEDNQLGQPESLRDNVGLAKDTLYQILVLLADSEKVSSRYRLTAKVGEDLSSLSSTDLEANLGALDNRMRKLAAKRQKRTGLGKLTRWALYDKEHYSKLVEDISKLLTNLEETFSVPEANAHSLLAQRDIEQVSGDTKEEQEAAVKTLQQLAPGVDNVLKEKVPAVAATRGISIGSIVIEENARVRDGKFVGAAWKGVANLPQGGDSIAIGSAQVKGNARVMNGDTYGDRDTFWD